MFVLGLVVGPAIGLLAGDFFSRSGGGWWWGALAIAFFLVFVLLAPIFAIELRLGLTFGTLLGVLIVLTPLDLQAPQPSRDP